MEAIEAIKSIEAEAWTPFKPPRGRIVKVGNVRKDSFLLNLWEELEELRKEDLQTV